MKKNLPLAIVIIGGFVWVLWAFIPHKIFAEDFINKFYLPWIYAQAPFGVILGVMSLCMMHFAKIQRKAPKWQYSFFALGGLLLDCYESLLNESKRATPFEY